jgi:hypothetical protein
MKYSLRSPRMCVRRIRPPVDQLPEVHAGIAARDLKLLHDVVGAVRAAGEEQQGVDLRHGPADTPGGAHFPQRRMKRLRVCISAFSVTALPFINN